MWRTDTPLIPPFPQTLPAAVHDSVRRYSEREFLVESEGRRLSYLAAERESIDIARGLLSIGAGKATRVGLLLPNSPEWVTSWLGISKVGALTIALSTLFQAKELAWALKEADVDTLVMGARFGHHDYIERIARAIPELLTQRSTTLWLSSHPYLRRIVVIGPCDRPWAHKGFESILDCHNIGDALLAACESSVHPSDDLVGICTSGSTAEPKIVIHSHGSLIRQTYNNRRYLGLREGDRNFSGMPFFWIGGITMNIMPVMFDGACLVFSSTSDPEGIVSAIASERVTRLSMWAAQVGPIVEQAARVGLSLDHVRIGLRPPHGADGRPIPQSQRFAGVLGMTETAGPHGAARLDEVLPADKGGSWGYAIEGMDRKIVSLDTGSDCAAGQTGELWVRGSTLMRGYYKREWAEVFTPDGWFRTGDLCAIDEDGYIWFSGRSTEMIKTSGANVAPREVEALMMTYPEILEAIVLGAPDPVKGELVLAAIVLRDGHKLSSAELGARLKNDISSYKIPRKVFWMLHEEIPRTASGKPIKPALRARLLRDGSDPIDVTLNTDRQGNSPHASPSSLHKTLR